MILAIAVLGLSASIVADKVCSSEEQLCVSAEFVLALERLGLRTVRYGMFIGVYGMMIASVGTAALFVDKIPMIVPLFGDAIGAVFYLAGGIAWLVELARLPVSCSKIKWRFSNNWYSDFATSLCRRCEAEHGLVWALFAFTAALALCDLFRRRDQVHSFK